MGAPDIKVGILESLAVEFVLTGRFRVTGDTWCDGTFYGGRVTAIAKDGKLGFTFGNEMVFTDKPITYVPQEELDKVTVFELKQVVIGVGFHWEQRENQVFRGALRLEYKEGKVLAINCVGVEEYLVSVISSEMKADSSLALLKAHAIMSRSWLLAQIRKQKALTEDGEVYEALEVTDEEYTRWYDREDHTLFHVCADDHCQRYQGIGRAVNPQVEQAVRETAGQVLMYNERIADARFSKCCGGVSERFEYCWEPVVHPYLQRVVDRPLAGDLQLDLQEEEQCEEWLLGSPDAFCNTKDAEVLRQVLNDYDHQAKDFYRWEVRYSQAEISELLRRRSGFDFGDILDLTPVVRGVSGRLTRLKITGTKKTLIVGKELEIRRWLSESHLYSSAFVVEKVGEGSLPEGFVLRGGGWGHGVGLCQIGAAVMGHKGYAYEVILAHYFRGATIAQVYSV